MALNELQRVNVPQPDLPLPNSPPVIPLHQDEPSVIDVFEELEKLFMEDYGKPNVAAANRYVRQAFYADDPDYGFDELCEAIFPIKTNQKPKKERPPPPKSQRGKKYFEHIQMQSLFHKNRRHLARIILDDMPIYSSPPPKDNVDALYRERFGNPKPDLHPIGTPKQNPNPEMQNHLFSTEEVRRALKDIDYGTAPGPDTHVNAPTLKKTPLAILVRIFNLWLVMERVPSKVKACRTTLIPKTKNDLDDLGNWRPITVGSLLLRLYAKLIDARLNVVLNPRQKAFIPVDGCGEHVSLLTTILRDVRKRRKHLNVVFLDVAKAYDCTTHDSIIRALKRHQVNPIIIRIIMNMYDGATTSINSGTGITEPIPILKGVKQGCPLSPKLFNMMLDELLDNLGDTWGYNLDGCKINSMAFADDLVLISNTRIGMCNLLAQTNNFLSERQLLLSPPKCCSIRIEPAPGTKTTRIVTENPFQLYGKPIKPLSPTDSTRYLGAHLSPFGTIDNHRVTIDAWLKRLSRCRLRPLQKLVLLRSTVLPKIRFGLSLATSTTSGSLKKIDRKIRQFVRRTLYIPKNLHNDYFYLKNKDGGLGLQCMLETVAISKLQLHNRLLRSDDAQVRGIAYRSDMERIRTKTSKWIGLDINPNPFQLQQFKKDLYRNHLTRFSHSQQGQGYSQIKGSKYGKSWLTGFLPMKQRDFIHGVELMTNNLPTRCNLRRGQPDADKRCRRCHKTPEWQMHVLQQCPMMADAITKRHNVLCGLLKDSAKLCGWSVRSEPAIFDPAGNRFKPDLVFSDGSYGIVCDVQVPYENDRNSLQNSYNFKVNKYKNIGEETVKEQLNLDDVEFMALVIGTRGTWTKSNRKLFATLELPSKLRESMCFTTLKESVKIWRLFLASLRLT